METKLNATHAMETNLEGDTRHENKLSRRHTPKLVQTATHAIKTKLKATHAKETNL